MFNKGKGLAVCVVAVALLATLAAEEIEQNSLLGEMSKTSMTDQSKPNGTMGPVLASNSPYEDQNSVHIEAGLLMQQIRLSDTDWASLRLFCAESNETATFDCPVRTESMERNQFNLEPGLRVGIGYNSDFDNWKVSTLFEWMPSVSRDAPGGLQDGQYQPVAYPKIFYPGNTSSATIFKNANSDIDVNYYLFEVFLSRGAYFSKKFSYEPYAGIKTTFIYYRSQSYFTDDVFGGTPDNQSYLVYSDISVWGVGPMIGMNGNFFLGSGFSVFSDANLAVLFGETDLRYWNGFYTNQINSDSIPGDTKLLDTAPITTLTMRCIIGLQYDYDISPSKQHLRCRAGFDARFYLEQYPTIQFVAVKRAENSRGLASVPLNNESGDFGMVGLILDVGLDF